MTELQSISLLQFENLFCNFYPRVVAYAATILNDRNIGEDIAQEVFMYVWEKRNRLHFGEDFYSYLFQTTYTRCIDHIRKNSRLEKQEQETLLKFAEEYQLYIDNNCQPIQELFSKDFEESLNTLIKQLPETRQQVFKLVYYEGYKPKEVAEKLQIPQRTVESHLYLTLKYLRMHLSPSDFLLLVFFCKNIIVCL
ncbi:MAG: RNA polymerase sigma-70 factor [Paludibacter sp.]|nr:RNA polymerase sigma-70 factor [Paludibacter sp.]MDD4198412.1 RNA polymerase sigma-70 factor [Paludibacter sp.]MDD4427090.1 RNA polymerase sigma-70 factor [Paludibacter sp.]